MAWDQKPEIYLKKDSPSPYDGVLIPELNYRAYKFYEKDHAPLMQTIENSDVPLTCPDKSCFENPIIWGVVGALIGSIVLISLEHH